ncbi:MORN repeat-containing protein 3-like [Argiope bruennichi]|uniref:MORN repeat-containing protein 3 n=1 Tax=Argiope bruennichi TaxID=94029 RepID=A0A8T0EN59_ARGBR|nr:MORN repeat-containing protein 3-like [Argiope bruennichi]KAF8777177.1 MORN repeat-containing protein 3 [Argiope bruennichi]
MLRIVLKRSKKPLRCLEISNRNGLHKAICDEDGDIYTGLWKDNEKHGFGIQESIKDKITYRGSWKNGRKHGEGLLYRSNTLSEFLYKGEWEKDKRNGQGINFYEDGGRYEGAWKKDKRHGCGQMDYSDGSIYVGSWKHDQRSGFGKMWFADGSTYEGDWKNGKRHGKGTMITKKQDKHEGFWKNDQKHGEGKFSIHENGLEFTGLWINDNFCCGFLELKNPDAPFPMKLKIPKWTLMKPEEVITNAKKYYIEKSVMEAQK